MTLKTARRRWATRRRKYVVGYIRAGNTLYVGDSAQYFSEANNCTDPLSLRQARQLLARMPSSGAAIFELTPIELGGGQP